jgi:hypothetical protein
MQHTIDLSGGQRRLGRRRKTPSLGRPIDRNDLDPQAMSDKIGRKVVGAISPAR